MEMILLFNAILPHCLDQVPTSSALTATSGSMLSSIGRNMSVTEASKNSDWSKTLRSIGYMPVDGKPARILLIKKTFGKVRPDNLAT